MRAKLLLLSSVAFLSACGGEKGDRSASGGAANPGGAGGTLIINPSSDVVQLFPPLVNEETSRWVEDQLFDRLAEIDSALTTVGDKGFTPRLATKWSWAKD